MHAEGGKLAVGEAFDRAVVEAAVGDREGVGKRDFVDGEDGPEVTATVDLGPRPTGRVPALVSVIIPARNSEAALPEQIDVATTKMLNAVWIAARSHPCAF